MYNSTESINNCIISGSNFDDNWVWHNDSYSLFAGSTFTAGGTANSVKTCDLSSYLPNDDYIYMVLLSGYGRTASGSGSCTLRVLMGTQVYANVVKYGLRVMCSEYHSTSTYACSGSLMLPIYPNDRWVTIVNSSTSTTGNCGLSLHGYRRLGLNS